MADQPAASGEASPSWPYRADLPQRFAGNYAKYLARGGQVRLADDVKGFVSDGRNRGDMARFYFLCLAFDQLVKEGVTGDLAELGVYKGNTATMLATFARRLGSTAYLLDTFEGFSDQDLKGIDAAARPRSFSDTSLDSVRAMVGEENVKYVKGFFPETASQLPPDGAYCLVHIDCDLYAPMTSALEYFYARLVPGGYLIVHDYSSLHWNGAEKAVDEFFSSRPECVIPLPDGAGSAAIRKARPSAPQGGWLHQKRRALLGADWTGAAHGRLADLLGTGWSGPEPWGQWGVGELHELHLVLPPGERRVVVEFDVKAALTSAVTEQHVDVVVDGRTIARWRFTAEANRGVRTLELPADLLRGGESGAAVTVALRPSAVIRPAQSVPGASDTRPLGVGLHRLRLAGP